MNLKTNYTYVSSEKPPELLVYQGQSDIYFDIKNENYTGLYQEKYNYDYSSYYDWLNQQEQLVARCRLGTNNNILLTNKNITIKKGATKRDFPLRQIQNIELKFKRLAFPLVTGGITAPLSTLATANRLIDLVPGIMIMLVSSLLFYYGWSGSYQINLDFKTHKISYFSDDEGENLKLLVRKGNQLLRRRYHLSG